MEAPDFIPEEEISQWDSAPDFIPEDEAPLMAPPEAPEDDSIWQGVKNRMGSVLPSLWNAGSAIVKAGMFNDPTEAGKVVIPAWQSLQKGYDEQTQKQEEAERTGRMGEIPLRSFARALPGLGPAIADSVEKGVDGKPWTAAGELGSDVLLASLGAKGVPSAAGKALGKPLSKPLSKAKDYASGVAAYGKGALEKAATETTIGKLHKAGVEKAKLAPVEKLKGAAKKVSGGSSSPSTTPKKVDALKSELALEEIKRAIKERGAASADPGAGDFRSSFDPERSAAKIQELNQPLPPPPQASSTGAIPQEIPPPPQSLSPQASPMSSTMPEMKVSSPSPLSDPGVMAKIQDWLEHFKRKDIERVQAARAKGDMQTQPLTPEELQDVAVSQVMEDMAREQASAAGRGTGLEGRTPGSFSSPYGVAAGSEGAEIFVSPRGASRGAWRTGQPIIGDDGVPLELLPKPPGM